MEPNEAWNKIIFTNFSACHCRILRYRPLAVAMPFFLLRTWSEIKRVHATISSKGREFTYILVRWCCSLLLVLNGRGMNCLWINRVSIQIVAEVQIVMFCNVICSGRLLWSSSSIVLIAENMDKTGRVHVHHWKFELYRWCLMHSIILSVIFYFIILLHFYIIINLRAFVCNKVCRLKIFLL